MKGGGNLKGMDLLERWKDKGDEDLIKGWVLDCEPPAWDLRYYGTSAALLDAREVIHQRGLEGRKEVIEADISLIKSILGDEPQYTWPPDSDDPEKYPLDHWWWHLDRIAERTYPADLLPEHLREIYLKAF